MFSNKCKSEHHTASRPNDPEHWAKKQVLSNSLPGNITSQYKPQPASDGAHTLPFKHFNAPVEENLADECFQCFLSLHNMMGFTIYNRKPKTMQRLRHNQMK